MKFKNYLTESKPKFKRKSEDEYEVSVNGKYIGDVFTTWRNPGGNGWTYSGAHEKWFKSRKEAAEALVKNK